MTRAWPLLTFLALSACTQAQRPYSFRAPSSGETATGTVARVLASEGYELQSADENLGVVQTKWKQTTDPCDPLITDVKSPHVVRRYTATLAPSGGSSDVTLRMDAKCCPDVSATLGEVEVTGRCTEMSGIYVEQQEEIDALGAKMQAALGSTPPSTGVGGSDNPGQPPRAP